MVRTSSPIRVGVTGALAAALVFGASACASTQTQHYYGASDGTRITLDSGTIEVVNLMVVVDDDNTGYLLGAVHNDSQGAETATLTAADSGLSLQVDLGPGATTNFTTDTEPPTLPTVAVPAGGNLIVTVSDAQGVSADVAVPVVDGSLPEYADFLATVSDA